MKEADVWLEADKCCLLARGPPTGCLVVLVVGGGSELQKAESGGHGRPAYLGRQHEDLVCAAGSVLRFRVRPTPFILALRVVVMIHRHSRFALHL